MIPQAIRQTLGLRLGENLRGIRHGERVDLIPAKKIPALRGFARGIDTVDDLDALPVRTGACWNKS